MSLKAMCFMPLKTEVLNSYKNIKIGSSVEKIYVNAFGGTVIDEIIIPENVDMIGDSTFRFCSSLKKFTVLNDNLEFHGDLFYGSDTKNNNQLIIVAREGSTAQKYAQDNGMPFEILK